MPRPQIDKMEGCGLVLDPLPRDLRPSNLGQGLQAHGKDRRTHFLPRCLTFHFGFSRSCQAYHTFAAALGAPVKTVFALAYGDVLLPLGSMDCWLGRISAFPFCDPMGPQKCSVGSPLSARRGNRNHAAMAAGTGELELSEYLGPRTPPREATGHRLGVKPTSSRLWQCAKCRRPCPHRSRRPVLYLESRDRAAFPRRPIALCRRSAR